MLGARARERFFRILLPLLAPGLAITLALAFVQAFTVFPSAVLLGAPAGPTRVISIAAYQAAFEQYDYPLASAIAMLMALVQVIIIVGLLGCAHAVLSAARPAAERAERHAAQPAAKQAVVDRGLGAGRRSSSSTCWR